MQKQILKRSEDFVLVLSLLAFLGGLVYRIYKLNWFGVVLSLGLVWYAYKKIYKHFKEDEDSEVARVEIRRKVYSEDKKNRFKFNPIKIFFAGLYFVIVGVCFYLLLDNRVDDSIISIWEYLPVKFFWFYGLASLVLIYNILRNTRYSLLLLIVHYFLSFSVVLLTYKIGYGFDPFIHQATMDLIDKNGEVLPKPFYYLGQYSIIVILHKITFIPIVLLDKFLVPVLASVLIPITVFRVAQKSEGSKRISQLLVLSLLVIPFSFFINTTPQNLAYLFLILSILYGVMCSNYVHLSIIYSLSLAAFFTQAIAGIPAILFAGLITVHNIDNEKLKRLGYVLFFVANSFALPLAFYFVNRSNVGVEDSGEKSEIFNLSDLVVPDKDNIILNYVYLYAFNFRVIVFAFLVFCVYILWKNKPMMKKMLPFLLASASLLVSFYLTKFLPFDFLINYERDNYTDRILLVTGFFLLPVFLFGVKYVIKSAFDLGKVARIIFILFFVGLLTVNLYISYPRHDSHFNSRGYSVGKYDVEAVKWIENDIKNDGYIVLANQQVSAAALSEFGFSKYYKGDIFYYPIPTGGELYQYYLRMVYDGVSRETMIEAMDLVGVDKAYFVLNKYWWAFPKLVEEMKFVADDWESIGNGEVFVFEFERDEVVDGNRAPFEAR